MHSVGAELAGQPLLTSHGDHTKDMTEDETPADSAESRHEQFFNGVWYDYTTEEFYRFALADDGDEIVVRTPDHDFVEYLSAPEFRDLIHNDDLWYVPATVVEEPEEYLKQEISDEFDLQTHRHIPIEYALEAVEFEKKDGY